VVAERRVLRIEIGTLEDALGQFADAWRGAERGEQVRPYEGVGFESLGELLATLTPRRWTAIERLRGEGPMTVYALAKALGRNYKNVHGDVKALEGLGIIERDPGGRVLVPWDEVEAHLRIAA
jgi:predicted transcriptional regulator